MILHKETRLAERNAVCQVVNFAWLPTTMKRNENDKDGEVIWLEKYVVTYYAFQPYPNAYPGTWEWKESRIERLTKSVLAKLESEFE